MFLVQCSGPVIDIFRMSRNNLQIVFLEIHKEIFHFIMYKRIRGKIVLEKSETTFLFVCYYLSDSYNALQTTSSFSRNKALSY